MGKVVIFIGTEKCLSNVIKYKYFDSIFKSNLQVVTTTKISSKYNSLGKVINYDSNWPTREIDLFHLYLLFKNFFLGNNKALNYELRNRIFGPYKIKSFIKAWQALKYFYSSILKIDWLFLAKNFRKTPHQLLIELRNSGLVGPGDYTDLYNILKKNAISGVVTITPFRDPKIYDLSQACFDCKIPFHVLTECWDNVSTGYGLPDNITELHLWSKQQVGEISRFFPNYTNKSNIIGSYRKNYSFEFINECDTISEKFDILYLGGYFYEDLNYTIDSLISAIIKSKLIDQKRNINIFVRQYPLKKQSIDIVNSEDWIRKVHSKDSTINVSKSNLPDLNDDFIGKKLVFAELTTAGLEALFRNIPTFFIGSHKSPRFLDSASGYNFSFAQPIKKSTRFFNLSLKSDMNKLSEALSSVHLLSEFKNYQAMPEEELEFYAQNFDFLQWNKLISLLSN